MGGGESREAQKLLERSTQQLKSNQTTKQPNNQTTKQTNAQQKVSFATTSSETFSDPPTSAESVAQYKNIVPL